MGPSQSGHGGSCWGQRCDVAAGVGRLCPCAEGPAWHRAPSCHCNHPTGVSPSRFVSQTLLRGKENGAGGRTAHFRAQSQGRHTWRRGDHFCHSFSHKDPSPATALKSELGASTKVSADSVLMPPLPHSSCPALSCCSPWKFALFPPDNKPCPRWVWLCSAPGSQHQSICQPWCHECIMENAIDPPRWGLHLRALMRQGFNLITQR